MKLPKICFIALLVASALGGPACATSKAPDEAKPAAEQTDAEPLSPTDKILAELERHGEEYETVQADIDYEMNQTLLEDIQKRQGKIWYKKPNLFRLEFTTPKEETFVFDGRTLYEKREASKQLIIYEIRRPDEEPVESLEIGRCPFPMPFGQNAETVKKHFDVELDKTAEKEEGQEVLLLKPKENSSIAEDYQELRFWVDTKIWLPVKIVTTDKSQNILTVIFHNVLPNKKIKASLFERPRTGRDWEIIEHLKPKEEPPPEGSKIEKPSD